MVPPSSDAPPAPKAGRRPRAYVAWSSGKDAAFALEELRRSGGYEVAGLLTTVTRDFDRVSMHGVRTDLLDAQARAVGLPVRRVEIPANCSNAEYERAMGQVVRELVSEGVSALAFGDLFLDEVRAYRESRLAGTGIVPLFPLWGRPTRALAESMIAAGLETRIVCLDPRRLSRSFAGRTFDRELLDALPPGVDPCGENGEFHTCVTDGPMFRWPVRVRPGPVVERDGFVFADFTLDGSGEREASADGVRGRPGVE